MAYFGVDKDVRVKEINLAFKNQIRNRGGIGIRSLGRIFKTMDFNGNKKLDLGEFEQALATFGLFPKKVDLKGLHSYYDIDGDGNISYEEFLRGLRDPLTERKAAMVERAFAIMDKDGSGEISCEDIAHLYDVSHHKDFKEGTKTKEQIIAEFLDSFDGAKGNNDGKVSHQEWCDYYTDLAMSTPSDDYFVVMMEQAWGVSEDEDSAVHKEQVMHLVNQMRHSLRNLSNGHQDEYQLRNIFNEFDTNGNGLVTLDELAGMVASLKISAERKFLSSLMKLMDTNCNGAIDLDEFINFIINDPYK